MKDLFLIVNKIAFNATFTAAIYFFSEMRAFITTPSGFEQTVTVVVIFSDIDSDIALRD